MRIPFAGDVRECHTRIRSATSALCVTMCCMETYEERLQAAVKKRTRAKQAFDQADADVRALLVEGRNELGKGPSELARLSGFTREWVAKIAPDPDAPAKPRRVVRVKRRPADD